MAAILMITDPIERKLGIERDLGCFTVIIPMARNTDHAITDMVGISMTLMKSAGSRSSKSGLTGTLNLRLVPVLTFAFKKW